MTTLGFLGLGAMGREMARRLVDAGHDVIVWNRSPEPVAELVAVGARQAESPAEALATEVSLSMLADDDALAAVLTPERIAPGTVHVSLASVSPLAADRATAIFRDAGADFVAAPVLGRPPVAAAGELNILVAGRAAAVATVTPYLDVLGRRIWPFGTEPRTANLVKIAINYNIVHALQALGESVALVEAHDVESSRFVELLTSTLFGGIVYTGYGRAIAERSYLPAGFALPLGLKDLGLAEAAAAEAGLHLATAATLRTAFETAMADRALREADWAAVAEVARRDRV